MGEPSKPLFLRFRDFWTCPWAPKPIICIFWNPKTPQIIQESYQNILKHTNVINVKNVKSETLIFWEKAGPDKSWRSVLNLLENLWYGINIFQKTWNGSLVIWDHRNEETLKPRNFETKKPNKTRNQETKKLWNQEAPYPSTYRLPPLHPTTSFPIPFLYLLNLES